MTQQQKVKEWMQLFGQDCPDKPCIPDVKILALRAKLIQEEFNELMQAFFTKNLHEVADAIADLLYVVHGTAIACGIDGDACFDAVHSNNMGKLWTTYKVEEAMNLEEGQLDHVIDAKIGNLRAFRQDTKALWVVKSPDGKVLKPIGYEKVDLPLG